MANAVKARRGRKPNLSRLLQTAVCEKDVESAYRTSLRYYFPRGVVRAPFHSDGILRNAGSGAHALLEFKFERGLDSAWARAEVLVQALYYLKLMADEGEAVPRAVFIGDRHKCFCLAVSEIERYLSTAGINWGLPPSAAAADNPALVAQLADDASLTPFVYTVDEHFDMLSAVEKLKKMAQGLPYAVTLTPQNLVAAFDRFQDCLDARYVKAGKPAEAKQAKTAELANLFFDCLTAPGEVYLHPKKEGTLVVRDREVRVKAGAFRAFFQEYKPEHTTRELEALTSVKDRLINEEYRRRTGAFFTPDIWAAEARKMIAESFGEDWKERYVVWDCCCGTAQLTRGETFRELYLSTLDQGDVDTIQDMGYNPGATVFQYDFLSEIGLGEQVPEGLRRAFAEGRPVLKLLNPPYGTANNAGATGTHKSGIALTEINKRMEEAQLGACRQQLYTQFMYKAACLGANVSLGIFTNSLVLCGETFDKFRAFWGTRFKFVDGFLFEASNFSGVAGSWAITFTVWRPYGL